MANRKRPSGITRKKAAPDLAEINRVLEDYRRKPSNTKVTLTVPKSAVYLAAQLGKQCIPPMTPNRYLTVVLAEGINDAFETLQPPQPLQPNPPEMDDLPF